MPGSATGRHTAVACRIAAHRVCPQYGVRTRRYKLIRYYEVTDEWELFDLEKDPHELHNVYADPAYAEIARTLEGELERLRAELGGSQQDSWGEGSCRRFGMRSARVAAGPMFIRASSTDRCDRNPRPR